MIKINIYRIQSVSDRIFIGYNEKHVFCLNFFTKKKQVFHYTMQVSRCYKLKWTYFIVNINSE